MKKVIICSVGFLLVDSSFCMDLPEGQNAERGERLAELSPEVREVAVETGRESEETPQIREVVEREVKRIANQLEEAAPEIGRKTERVVEQLEEAKIERETKRVVRQVSGIARRFFRR